MKKAITIFLIWTIWGTLFQRMLKTQDAQVENHTLTLSL